MQLKINKELLIEAEKVKIAVLPVGAPLKTQADIVITSGQVDPGAAYLVNQPGEYEVKDVFIYALAIANPALPDLFSIFADGVTVAFIGSEIKEIPKSVIDQLGVIDIVVLDLNNDAKDLELRLDLLEDLDPEILIPLRSDTETNTKISKYLGLELPEKQPKLKASDGDFSGEERSLKIVLL
jgi:hypothetical protein